MNKFVLLVLMTVSFMMSGCAVDGGRYQSYQGDQYRYGSGVSDRSHGGERNIPMVRGIRLSNGGTLVEALLVAVQRQSDASDMVLSSLESFGWSVANDRSDRTGVDVAGRLVIYTDGRVAMDCDAVGRVERTPTVRDFTTIKGDIYERANAISMRIEGMFQKQIADTARILSGRR